MKKLALVFLLFLPTLLHADEKATRVNVDTSSFSGNLSGTDTTVQKALDTIDDMSSGGGTWGSITGTLSDQTDLQSALDAKGSGTVTSLGTSSPITGGTITTTGTIGITQADTSTDGYLSSTDWNTFNGKQASGNYITALTGDVTASGPGSATSTLATVNSNVGSFTNASLTVNAKGLVTAASNGTSTSGNVGIGTTGWNAIYASNGDTVTASSVLRTVGSNIGIGSASPGTSLDVTGIGRFSTGVSAGRLTNLTSNGFVKTGSSNGTLSVDTGTYPTYSGMTANYVQKATSTTAIGNSQIRDDGTSVGIKTAPLANTVLAVSGSGLSSTIPVVVLGDTQGRIMRARTADWADSASGSELITGFGAGTGNTYFAINAYTAGSTNAGTLTLQSPAGFNVGIGSTAAGSKLDVNGNVRILNSGTLSVAGNVGIGGANTTTAPLAVTGRASVTQNIGIGTTFGNHALSVMSGNVGIGTWNPIALLQVGGASSASYVTFSSGYGSDPCTGSGSSAVPINSFFRDTTGSGQICYCNESGDDVKTSDYSTSCY